jgi:DNA-directed RNA polymerase specialized sigma24 family protein
MNLLKDVSDRDARIVATLAKLEPRLRQAYPELRGQAISRALRRARRRLVRRHSDVPNAVALAETGWALLRRMAAVTARNAGTRHPQYTCELQASSDRKTTPRDVEAARAHRALQHLSHFEQMVCVWKNAGFTTEEIADFNGCRDAAVDRVFRRARHKLQAAVNGTQHPR